jgi:hypothetical protein
MAVLAASSTEQPRQIKLADFAMPWSRTACRAINSAAG